MASFDISFLRAGRDLSYLNDDSAWEERVGAQGAGDTSTIGVLAARPAFVFAPCADPAKFAVAATSAGTDPKTGARVPPLIKMDKGTTTLAFCYAQGIVVAVDSRASGGSYIASQSVRKIIEINPYLLGTMAGGAADCQFWQRQLGIRCALHELRSGKRITVSAASKILASMVGYYRGMGLSMGTMVTGWDRSGPGLFYVDSDGQRLRNNLFSVGSGSTHAYGVLDAEYRWDLTREEAVALGQRAIMHATHRDAYSGGIVTVYHVDKTGWKHISSVDASELYYTFMASKAQNHTGATASQSATSTSH